MLFCVYSVYSPRTLDRFLLFFVFLLQDYLLFRPRWSSDAMLDVATFLTHEERTETSHGTVQTPSVNAATVGGFVTTTPRTSEVSSDRVRKLGDFTAFCLSSIYLFSVILFPSFHASFFFSIDS